MNIFLHNVNFIRKKKIKNLYWYHRIFLEWMRAKLIQHKIKQIIVYILWEAFKPLFEICYFLIFLLAHILIL